MHNYHQIKFVPYLLLIITIQWSIAQVITVDANGGADYTTIQEAVNNANANDTINVLPGVYQELINLSKKHLVLIGANAESTIISTNQKYVYIISGDSFFLTNFTITGMDSNDQVAGITGSAVVESVIIQNTKIGINLHRGIVRNSTIQNNVLGICVDSGLIFNNVIKNNKEGIRYILSPGEDEVNIRENEIYENEIGIMYYLNMDINNGTKVIGNDIFNNTFGIYYFRERPTLSEIDSSLFYTSDAKWNWWGTTVEDTIDKYIFDRKDNIENLAIVDMTEWLSEKQDGQPYHDTAGVHNNNIFSNTDYNIYAFDPFIDGVKNNPELINETFQLNQNYPNPFNPSTTISFYIKNKTANVKLNIYDVKGSLIKTLTNSRLDPGYHSFEWNGKDQLFKNVSSGVYFYTLEAGEMVQTKKLLLVR